MTKEQQAQLDEFEERLIAIREFVNQEIVVNFNVLHNHLAKRSDIGILELKGLESINEKVQDARIKLSDMCYTSSETWD